MTEAIQTTNTEMNTQSISAPLYESRVWLKILGWCSIGNGVIFALTLFGLIVAWIPIWLGVLCLKAAKTVGSAFEQGDAAALLETNRNLRKAIVIMGVLQLLMLAVYVGTFIFAILGSVALMGIDPAALH